MTTNEALMGYQDGLLDGELRVPRCGGCDRLHWPPRECCPHCGSAELSWDVLPREGELYTWTVIGRSSLPRFSARTPYVVGVIAYPDLGIRLVGGVAGDPATMEFGRAARWEIIDGEELGPVPRWTLVAGGASP